MDKQQEKEFNELDDSIKLQMLANVKKHKAMLEANKNAKTVRDHILSNCLNRKWYDEKNSEKVLTGRKLESNKVNVEKVCELFNNCVPESPIMFKWHFKGGWFVDGLDPLPPIDDSCVSRST